MPDPSVVLVTQARHYVGPAAVQRLAAHGPKVVAHDASVTEAAEREAWAQEQLGVGEMHARVHHWKSQHGADPAEWSAWAPIREFPTLLSAKPLTP